MLEAARAGSGYAEVEAAGLAAVAPGTCCLASASSSTIVQRRGPARGRDAADRRSWIRSGAARRRPSDGPGAIVPAPAAPDAVDPARTRAPRAHRSEHLAAGRPGLLALPVRQGERPAGVRPRARPRGFRLDLEAGSSERWAPGETRTVRLVRFGGAGDAAAREARRRESPLPRRAPRPLRASAGRSHPARRHGPLDRGRGGSPGARRRADLGLREGHPARDGPVRRGRSERARRGRGRRGRRRPARSASIKADIGIKDGRIAGIGRAGNPAISDGIDLVIGPHTRADLRLRPHRDPGRRRQPRPLHQPEPDPRGALRRRDDADQRRLRRAAGARWSGRSAASRASRSTSGSRRTPARPTRPSLDVAPRGRRGRASRSTRTTARRRS